MSWFRNLKIGSKLLLSFMLILAIAIGAGIFALVNMNAIDNGYGTAMTLTSERMQHIFASKDHYSKARMDTRELFYPKNTRDDITGCPIVLIRNWTA